MISTMTMIGVGKVYDNLMVDLRPTNKKLVNRSITIIQDICDLNEQDAQTLYEEAEIILKRQLSCIYVIQLKKTLRRVYIKVME